MRVPANSEGMTSFVFCRQSLQQQREVVGDRLRLVRRIRAEQVVRLAGVVEEVVQFALRTQSADERRDRHSGCAVGDIPRQVEQWPDRVVLDVAVFLCPDGPDRVEGVVIRLGGVHLGADGRVAVGTRCAGAGGMRHAVDVGRHLEPEQLQQCGHQVHAAEQIVIDPRRLPAVERAGAR